MSPPTAGEEKRMRGCNGHFQLHIHFWSLDGPTDRAIVSLVYRSWRLSFFEVLKLELRCKTYKRSTWRLWKWPLKLPRLGEWAYNTHFQLHINLCTRSWRHKALWVAHVPTHHHGGGGARGYNGHFQLHITFWSLDWPTVLLSHLCSDRGDCHFSKCLNWSWDAKGISGRREGYGSDHISSSDCVHGLITNTSNSTYIFGCWINHATISFGYRSWRLLFQVLTS